MDVRRKINLAIVRAFENEGIDFASDANDLPAKPARGSVRLRDGEPANEPRLGEQTERRA